MENTGPSADGGIAIPESTVQVKADPTAPSAAPSEHDSRYDRQLRLWAPSGQQALEDAAVLVIGATATASQSLKNLVLPGVGSITILDNTVVTHEDVGKDFFLENPSIGKQKGSEQLSFLLELNDSVKGNVIVDVRTVPMIAVLCEAPLIIELCRQSLKNWLSNMSNSLDTYALVLAFDSSPEDTNAIAAQCWEKHIPFLLTRSSGFYSYIRTQYPEMTLVETHPSSIADLRLDAPFPELKNYVDSFRFDELDSHEHIHIPALLIILKCLEYWADSHEGNPPEPGPDMVKLRKLIRQQRKFDNDENIEEAVALVNRLYQTSEVPEEISQLFEYPQCKEATLYSSPFWLHVNALSTFVHSSLNYNPQKFLPLPGNLPDMKATSEGYHALSTIYRNKAKADLQHFRKILERTCSSIGIPVHKMESISGLRYEDSATFVKHAAFLKVLRGRKITIGTNDMTTNRDNHPSWLRISASEIQERLLDANEEGSPPSDLLPLYIALLTEDNFVAKYARRPSLQETSDLQNLDAIASQILSSLGSETPELSDSFRGCLQEIARANGSELPQISAWLGGIIAQESIKLITRQYIPLNGALVLDGIGSRTSVFEA